MEPLDTKALPNGALLLVDSAPIIYTLEAHPKFAARYKPMFAWHAAGELLLAVTTITIAEVLTGPLGAGEEALAKRYRAVMASGSFSLNFARSRAAVSAISAVSSTTCQDVITAR